MMRNAAVPGGGGPPLVQCVTQEEEEEEGSTVHYIPVSTDPHADLVQSTQSTKGRDRKALAYLLRYETMVRQQEAEDMSTLAHLQPCLRRLQELAGLKEEETDSSKEDSNQPDNDDWLLEEISFARLKVALERLQQEEEDTKQDDKKKKEFMTTDRQLMMVLWILTQKAGDEDDETSISWAEFLQCYKICIVGMMTLQHLPSSSEGDDKSSNAALIRARAKDRTLSMLSLFEPPSTHLFQDNFFSSNKNAFAWTEGRHKAVLSGGGKVQSRTTKRQVRRSLAALTVLAMIVWACFSWLPLDTFSFGPISSQAPVESSRRATFPSKAAPVKTATRPVLTKPSSSNQKPVAQLVSTPLDRSSVASASMTSNSRQDATAQRNQNLPTTQLLATALAGGTAGMVGGPALMAVLSSGSNLVVLGRTLLASPGPLALVAVGGLAVATLVVRGVLSVVSRVFRPGRND